MMKIGNARFFYEIFRLVDAVSIFRSKFPEFPIFGVLIAPKNLSPLEAEEIYCVAEYDEGKNQIQNAAAVSNHISAALNIKR